jgi:ABC-type transport system involved in multi-copper enzyme maturation permease subunit
VIGRIYAIALNTFREAIRQRVLYGILVVVVGFNLFAIVLGEMSLHEEARVARDVGIAGVSLFGAITAIILGVSLLYGEIQKKTLYTILAKPIERHEFVLGKYLGMATTLTLLVVLFAVAMVGLLWLQDVEATPALAKAVILAYQEVLIVAAVAVFFSSFSTPFLSGIFTFAVFFVGRVTPEMRGAVEQSKLGWVRDVCGLALKVLPDFHVFSISGGVVEGEHVSIHSDFVAWSYVGTATAYALFLIACLLVLSAVIFSRRSFT